MKRKKFVHTGALGVGALVLGGPVAALLGSGEPSPIPRRVGATDIEQVRAATQVFNSWGLIYGGGVVRDAAMGQLRWSAGLLEAICPDRLRPQLFSAVGYFADVAAFIAVDANADEEAHRAYNFALACAEKADNWPLRGEILSSMAKQAIWTGRPDEGLTRAEQGLVRADRLTAAGRSLLHTDRARALAKMRRVGETLAAVGTADDHYAHATPADESPYLPYYSPARHGQLTGQALFDLALLGGDPGKATDQLAAAAAGQPGTVSQAICLAKLASLTMVTGDPLQAAAIGHQVVDAASTIRSRRASEELRELFHHAAIHQHLGEVAHLRKQIGALLVRTDSL